MNYDITHKNIQESKVLEYLEEKKFARVIDVGGVQRPWAVQYVTAYVDLIHPFEWRKRYPDMYNNECFWKADLITGNIEYKDVQSKLLQEVDQNGLYDFAICTQVIEHLGNPGDFLDVLSRIAKGGFISVPNKYFELQKGIHWDQPFRGSLAHRWISTIRDDTLWMFPKLGFLEHLELDEVENESLIGELGFMWRDSIPYRVVDDSNIGPPDPMEAIEFFKREILIGA